jgi:hypothetical protein
MAGNLNAKHVDWKSMLSTIRSWLLRDYASEHSCLFYGPDTPTTIVCNTSATPDVLDQRPSHPNLTTCWALRSDHVSVLISTKCCSSFLKLPDLSQIRRTDWVKFQVYLEDRLPSTTKLRKEMEIGTCVEELSSVIVEALATSVPRSPPWQPTSNNTGTYSGWNTP